LHRPFLGLIAKDTSPKAALSSSQDENRRAQTLLKEGSGTPEGAQQANSDLIQKEAAFDAAQAALLQAKRQLAVPAAQRQASRQMDERAGPTKFELMCWQCGVNPDPPSKVGFRAGSIAWKLINGEVGADTRTLDRAFGFSPRTPVCSKTPRQRGA
jgi:hypothetical protein